MKRLLLTLLIPSLLVGCGQQNETSTPSSPQAQVTQNKELAKSTGTQQNSSPSVSSSTKPARTDSAHSMELKQAYAAKPSTRSMWQRTLIAQDCLQGKGHKIVVDKSEPEGYLNPKEMTESERAQYRQEVGECDQKHSLAEFEPMTRELASKEYDYRVKMLECLRGLGHSLGDAPSKQGFVDKLIKSTKTTEDLRVWSPHEDFQDLQLDQGTTIKGMTTCPRYPTP